MTKFIILRFDLHFDWDTKPPIYRVYINDEMFTERTYRAKKTECYKELLQLKAPIGVYRLDVKSNDTYTLSNSYIETGDGKMINSREFEII